MLSGRKMRDRDFELVSDQNLKLKVQVLYGPDVVF